MFVAGLARHSASLLMLLTQAALPADANPPGTFAWQQVCLCLLLSQSAMRLRINRGQREAAPVGQKHCLLVRSIAKLSEALPICQKHCQAANTLQAAPGICTCIWPLSRKHFVAWACAKCMCPCLACSCRLRGHNQLCLTVALHSWQTYRPPAWKSPLRLLGP